MRHFNIGGRSVSIGFRELDAFQGVARGGLLLVSGQVLTGDLRVTSWSRRGFDRSPNVVDLVALVNRGLFSIAEVSGRRQIALTPIGKEVAEILGCYSLQCLVRGPAIGQEEQAETVEEGSGYEPFQLDDDGEPVAAPPTLPSATDPPVTEPGEGCTTRPGPDPEPEPEVPAFPELPPEDASFKELEAFADKYGVDHTGMRSKAKVRAAIEAHFST